MHVHAKLTKSEVGLLLDGIQLLLIEENKKSGRRFSGWKATRRYNAADALEARLIELVERAGSNTQRREGEQ
jgi:hypothetical protein